MTISNIISTILLCSLVFIGFSITSIEAEIPFEHDQNLILNRQSFPSGFIFGTASASYQVEGAAGRKYGRGPSIWDHFTHNYPERVADRSNGDVATDHYHRYKEDVKNMKDMNTDAYRFSISWSRLLPNGKLSGGVNQEGINFYNNLTNELIEKGLTPFVTLFHWDLPQALEEEYGGFLSPKIVDHFRDFADLCYKEFGDRVKHWITLNEPWTYASYGYATGVFPPARCSTWQNPSCFGGNSSTEPYIVTHYMLLSHSAAVKLYRDKYQAQQKGIIGITLVSAWFTPYNETSFGDHEAASRATDFMFGWYMDPITRGQYPRSMRNLVGSRLPKFSLHESGLLRGSFDFLGFNYYTANFAADVQHQNCSQISYSTDSRAKLTTVRNGIPIGPASGSDWLFVYPLGFYKLLKYIKEKYNPPQIYITENGLSEMDDPKIPHELVLLDYRRIDYYIRHFFYLRKAIEEGVNVKGYFAWSIMDNFEWAKGYTERFGIYYVDFKNDQKRYPKLSAGWFKNFLKKDSPLYVSA